MSSSDWPSMAERLASVEARMDRMDDPHALIVGLRGDMNRQFDLVSGQLGEFRADMNRRFEQVDRRFEQVDHRFEQVDHRFAQVDHRFAQVEQRFQMFDVKVDRQFMWIVGIQVTLVLAIIGAMAAAYYR